MAEKAVSTDLVLHDKIKAAEQALAELVIYTETKYRSGGSQYKKKMRDKMDKAFQLFTRLTSGLGQTEYDTDGGYSGDQVLEKYRHAVSESWQGREEEKDSVKAITAGEIERGHEDMEDRRAKLQSRRSLAIAAAEQIKQLVIEQAKRDGDDITADHDPDDVVDRALRGKPLKGRPTVVQASYTPLFANDGRVVERRISHKAIAAPDKESSEYLDSYHDRQLDILKEADTPEDAAGSRVRAERNAQRAQDDMQRRRVKQDASSARFKAAQSHKKTDSDDEI